MHVSFRSSLYLFLAAFIIALIAGCGSSAKTYNTNYSTTIGQELSDLRKARDQGAISDREYADMKRKILERDR